MKTVNWTISINFLQLNHPAAVMLRGDFFLENGNLGRIFAALMSILPLSVKFKWI